MAKVGDTVRYLNAVGGGVIKKIDGKMAFVEEDGFETPVLLKDIVVVLPAGHVADAISSKKFFNQEAFDEGKKIKEPEIQAESKRSSEEEMELPVVETIDGDTLNVTLAFEPSDVKNLGKSTFAAIIVNDSNYFLDFIFLRRSAEERGWTLTYRGTVAPNESIDVAVLRHDNLSDFEKVAFQCSCYKKDKIFTLQPSVSVTHKLDLTKFHKFHCFRPGVYFDTPVIELPLVKDGNLRKQLEIDPKEIEESIIRNKYENDFSKELSKKYKVDNGRRKENMTKLSTSSNPNKVLPLIEVDLHIVELTDSLVGMEPKDMLEMQMAEVKKRMKENSRRIGQKIVFIHGKGDGVLRKAVIDYIKKEYPKAELQDASFREYGFGATQVTIH